MPDARDLCVQSLIDEQAAYRTALTRILRWAHREFDNECAFVDGNELFSALADAGFEIDNDDCLVIHGERVRE